MPSISIVLTPEAHRQLVELASRERRRVYAQAEYMLERALVETVAPREASADTTSPRRARRRE